LKVFASVLACFVASAAFTAAEEKPEILYSSPSGAWRIERNGGKAWVISNKDSAQRAELPPLEGISPFDDEFHASPNDEWIFGLNCRHWKAFRLSTMSFTLRLTMSGFLACEAWPTVFPTAIYFIESIHNTSRLRRQRKTNPLMIASGHIA
jgi:hypothetical protein